MPMYSFMMSYVEPNRGPQRARRVCELSDSVTCDTVQEARQFMMLAYRDLELQGAKIQTCRTYLSNLGDD